MVIYPFMKRVTYWPQLFLGLAFSWGALVGWVAVRGALSPEPLVLYLAAIAWTIGYDTIYAHQDKTDDVRVGVKSTALAFGENTKPLTGLFYGIFVAGVALAGHLTGIGGPFLVVLGVAAVDLARQLATVDLDDPGSCHKAFFRQQPDWSPGLCRNCPWPPRPGHAVTDLRESSTMDWKKCTWCSLYSG